MKDKKETSNLYIVVYAIKEDGKSYAPGDDYKGKRAEYFLNGGQIRPKTVSE